MSRNREKTIPQTLLDYNKYTPLPPTVTFKAQVLFNKHLHFFPHPSVYLSLFKYCNKYHNMNLSPRNYWTVVLCDRYIFVKTWGVFFCLTWIVQTLAYSTLHIVLHHRPAANKRLSTAELWGGWTVSMFTSRSKCDPFLLSTSYSFHANKLGMNPNLQL